MRDTVFISNTRPGIARAAFLNGQWQVEHLLPGEDVRCLTVDPHNPDRLFAGTQGAGVLRSDDAGRTWQRVGLDGQIIKSMAVSPTTPGWVVAGAKPPLVFASRDGGDTWQELEGFRDIPGRDEWWSPAEPPGTAYVNGIDISPVDPDLIVAGIEYGAVIRSEDGERTWSAPLPNALADCHSLTFHRTRGEYVYEGGSGGGAAISRDAGRTWEIPREGLDRSYGWAVGADPEDPETWYVSVSPSPRQAHSDRGIAEAFIFRRRAGEPWQKLGGGLPQPLDFMPYALLTPEPGEVIAGLRNGDLWRTTDYGETWQQIPVNLGRIDHALVMLR